MNKTYDAIVIGTGQAGPSLARRLAERGHEGRHHRAQTVRRHLRQHRLHPDQDTWSPAPTRRTWRAGPPSSASTPAAVSVST